MRNLLNVFIFSFTFFGYSQTELKNNQIAPQIKITNWLKNAPADKTLVNKFIVLEFWATWCKPCLEYVPHLNELQKKYKQDNLLFLSISDEKEARISKILEKINFETIVVNDTSKTTFENYKSLQYNDVMRPTTILIDDQGKIKWVGYPKLLTEKVLQSFLQNKLTFYNYFTSNQFKKDIDSNDNKLTLKDFKEKLLHEIENPSITEYLYVEKSSPDYGKSRIGDVNTKTQFGTQIKLNQIYAEVVNKPLNEIQIAEALMKENYNYYLINKTGNSGELEALLLQKLNLKKEVATKEIEGFELKLNNFSNLKSKGEWDKKKYKFTEDDEVDQLTYTNYTITELLTDLNNRFSLFLTNEIRNNEPYDFVINYSSTQTILSSLEKHNFELIPFKKSIAIFKIDKADHP